MPTEIEQQILQVIARHFKVDAECLMTQATFEKDLKGDSLTIMELILALEKAFGIHVPDEQVGKLRTVGQLVEYVRCSIR